MVGTDGAGRRWMGAHRNDEVTEARQAPGKGCSNKDLDKNAADYVGGGDGDGDGGLGE